MHSSRSNRLDGVLAESAAVMASHLDTSTHTSTATTATGNMTDTTDHDTAFALDILSPFGFEHVVGYDQAPSYASVPLHHEQSLDAASLKSKPLHEDLTAHPFDFKLHDDITAFPLNLDVPYHPSLVSRHLALNDDGALDSPLGLASISSLSSSSTTSVRGSPDSVSCSLDEFLASPMFGDSNSNPCASAETGLPSLDGFDMGIGMPSLFTFAPPPTLSSNPLPALPTPAPARHQGNFASHSPAPLPLDAPIQPRSYLLPSVTARKRRTSAVEKELAKRSRVTSMPTASASTASASTATTTATATATATATSTLTPTTGNDPEIPEDLVAAVERKRLQNTLSARKSRAKRLALVNELQERNEVLERENDRLVKRVGELEALLAL